MNRIILIGPVYPYKGGIAHYTGMMYRALSKKYNVSMISFKLQYPKMLYKKEQKDYQNDSFKIEDTNYWINTANPINWISISRKIKKINPDLIICQWWHPYFAPCYWMLEKLLKSYQWLFVCHNVFPHERFPMDQKLIRMVLRAGSYFIVQSKMDAEDLMGILPNPVFKQTVHPTYNAFRFTNMDKHEARNRLNYSDDRKIILFFGFVREYKGLKHLVNAMPKIKEDFPDIQLLVVGDFSGDKDKYLQLIHENQAENEIRIIDGYIPDKEVEKYFASCDLVVLPYESATQSGIVQIAYGFEKPVVATNVGGLPDVVKDGETGYLVDPKDPAQIADAVIRFYKENREEEFCKNVAVEAYRFSWDRMVEAVEELYGK